MRHGSRGALHRCRRLQFFFTLVSAHVYTHVHSQADAHVYARVSHAHACCMPMAQMLFSKTHQKDGKPKASYSKRPSAGGMTGHNYIGRHNYICQNYIGRHNYMCQSYIGRHNCICQNYIGAPALAVYSSHLYTGVQYTESRVGVGLFFFVPSRASSFNHVSVIANRRAYQSTTAYSLELDMPAAAAY